MSSSYYLNIHDFSVTHIKGCWHDVINNEWRSFEYTKVPDRDEWNGKFTLITSDAYRKACFYAGVPIPPSLIPPPPTSETTSESQSDTSELYTKHEYGVKINLKQKEDGKYVITGYGENSYGKFTLLGTDGFLTKNYVEIYPELYNPKKRARDLKDFSTLKEDREKLTIRMILMVAFNDKYLDLEREVVEGKKNLYEVKQALQTDEERELFQKKYSLRFTFNTREKILRMRKMNEERRQQLFQNLAKVVETLKDTTAKNSSSQQRKKVKRGTSTPLTTTTTPVS